MFEDRRYIRVNGRPLFLVYQPSLLPDPPATVAIWREEAQRAGVGDIYVCGVESYRNRERAAPASLGFDAAVEFQPDSLALLTPTEKAYWRIAQKVGLLSGDVDGALCDLGAARAGAAPVAIYPLSMRHPGLGQQPPAQTRRRSCYIIPAPFVRGLAGAHYRRVSCAQPRRESDLHQRLERVGRR